MKQFIIRHKILLLSLSTGFLLALSWPARGFPFLAFIALLPLLQVEDHLYQNRSQSRPVRMFVHAWLAFFVFNVLTTWWIMYATLPGMLVAVLLNPVFMAVPWVLMHAARRVLPGRQGQVSLLLFWLCFEYLHAQWDLSWSWLDLGNVFASVPVMVQWYEYTGTAGGTLWILVSNLMLFSLLKNLSGAVNRKKGLIQTALLVLTLAIPGTISLFLWYNYEEDIDPVEVVIVQPSHDPYEVVDQLWEAEVKVAQLIELADQRITTKTRFVVAPEAAIPLGIQIQNDEDNYAVRRLREHQFYNPMMSWVVGSMTYITYESGQERPNTARPYPAGNRYYDVYNSAVMIESLRPITYYHKSKLVPGIEKMPFFTVLKPIGKIVSAFGGTAGSMGTQNYRGVFKTRDDIAVAPAVCYESIYGSYMGEYFRNGAGLIFIITNDGWWRNTPGHRQHFQYARLRAIESRRSIARAASTGISGFINQKGEVISHTSWWEPTALSHSINQNYKLSFYSRQGNFLGKLSLFLSVLLVVYMVTQRMIKGR